MYSLIIYFINRKIILELWNGNKISQADTINGAKDLILLVNRLLEQNGLTLTHVTKIGLLNGPGSFTSIRIVIGTVLGLSSRRDIQIYPFRLDELISGEICLEIGRNLYYVYSGEWNIVTSLNKEYEEVSWHEVGAAIHSRMGGVPSKLAPLYLA